MTSLSSSPLFRVDPEVNRTLKLLKKAKLNQIYPEFTASMEETKISLYAQP